MRKTQQKSRLEYESQEAQQKRHWFRWEVLLVLAVSLLVIALSVRGYPGNPTDTELLDPKWNANGPFELSPERGRFALTYALIEHKSFYFSLPLARFAIPDLGYKNGHYVSLFAPGVSFLTIPGYLIGKYFGAAQTGTFAMIGFFAVINAMIIMAIIRRLGGSVAAGAIGALCFLFATPAFAYAVTLYQHHISTFLILMSVYLLLLPPTFWSFAGIWLLCASSIPVDYPNLFLMFPIGIAALTRVFVVSSRSETKLLTLRFGLILAMSFAAIPLMFFLWFNKMSYDNPLQFSGTVATIGEIDKEGNPAQPKSENLQNTERIFVPQEKKSAFAFFRPRNLVNGMYTHLFSPDRGVLYFTPVIIIGILGIIALTKSNSFIVQVLLGIIGANVILYSMWGDPWGGWAFGSRYLIPAYAVMGIFIGLSLSTWRKNIAVLILFFVLFSYSVAVNTSGALSSNANPPKIQILALEEQTGKRERFSYDRNVEMLRAGNSKSFAYHQWFSHTLDAWRFHHIIVSILLSLGAILMGKLYLSSERRLYDKR